MGFPSQTGYIGFKTQAVKGTYMDPGAVAPNQGIFIRHRGGSLGGNRELMIPDPEIGGNRDIPDAQFGPISFSGDLDLYTRMESLAFFLKGALGGVSTSGAVATGYTHVITGSDAASMPWISVEEQISNTYERFKYTDAKVNTFHMEADATGYFMSTVGMLALEQELLGVGTIPGNRRTDTSALIAGTNITVEWGGVALPAKSFSFDINNNIEDDDFRLGSFFLGDAVEKRREITMSVTIRPEDSTLWRTAMWGGPAATTPGGLTYKDDVEINVTSYEMIPGSTGPAVPYSAVFVCPQAIIAPFNTDPQGDDVLEHDIEIRPVRPDSGVSVVTATIKNSYATVP